MGLSAGKILQYNDSMDIKRTSILALRLIACLMLFASACQPGGDLQPVVAATPSPRVTVQGQSEYAVHQTIVLTNEGAGQPDKQNIWVALIRDFPPYQDVRSMEISPKDYELVVDEYGNHYAEFDFSAHPPGTDKIVQIDYEVVVYDLAYDLSTCEGEMPGEFVQPELHIESANPQIVSLASQVSKGKRNVCEQVRAFYDYIGDELVYSYNGDSWGAQAALGPMGADCTEYAALLAALSRSQGIPARYFEGLLYLNQETDSMAQVEHAWPDVYLPGIGWVPTDPTLGRALSDRDTYFAHHTPDHIIVTLGSDPSTLRGSHYWTHLYWPGNSTKIRVEAKDWEIDLVDR